MTQTFHIVINIKQKLLIWFVSKISNLNQDFRAFDKHFPTFNKYFHWQKWRISNKVFLKCMLQVICMHEFYLALKQCYLLSLVKMNLKLQTILVLHKGKHPQDKEISSKYQSALEWERTFYKCENFSEGIKPQAIFLSIFTFLSYN